MHTSQPNLEVWKNKASKALKPPMQLEDLDWLLPEGIRIRPVYDAQSLGPEHAYLQAFHRDWEALAAGRKPRFLVSGHGLPALRAEEIQMAEGYGFTAWDLSECPESEAVKTGLPKVERAWGRSGTAKVQDPLMDSLRSGKWTLPSGWNENFSVVLHASDVAKAGGNPVQELAMALLAADFTRQSGAETDFQKSAGKWAIQLSAGTSFWLELAKFRAMRLIWMHYLSENGVKNQAGIIRAETGTLTWSRTDPDTNLLRHTSSVLSALMGGADEVLIHPHRLEEPLDSVRLAVNIGLLALEEAHLDRAFDPAHGSYFLEILTHELATAAWKKYRSWSENSVQDTIESGRIQEEILSQSRKTLDQFASKEKVQLGVNTYPSELSRPGNGFPMVAPQAQTDFNALKPVFADA